MNKNESNSNDLNEEETNLLKEKFKDCDCFTRRVFNVITDDAPTNDIIFDECTGDELCCLGDYYQFIIKNYGIMKKCYLMAINRGSAISIGKLNRYFLEVEKDYELAKKFSLQSIDNESTSSMYNLGYYHQYVSKKYDLMEKYYLMAIDKGCCASMNNLGCYHKETKNYDLMKKYLTMAADKGYLNSIGELSSYYHQIEKNYDLAKKYFLMIIDKENDNIYALHCMGFYCESIDKDYNLMEYYYLQATAKGNTTSMNNLGNYYADNMPIFDSLRNYVYAVIEGQFKFESVTLFSINDTYFTCGLINLFCEIIDHEKLYFDNFKYCAKKIIWYFNSKNEYIQLINVEHFMKYIGKLYYKESKKYKEFKEYLEKELKLETSVTQIFMISLRKFYDEYIEEIYAPGGQKYIKTKEHFKMMAEIQKDKTNIGNDNITDDKNKEKNEDKNEDKNNDINNDINTESGIQ